MLWRPDITLYNGIGAIMTYNDDRRLVLNNNGMILWLLPARLESICNDMTLDGGQNVTCKWKFGSWTYNGLQLNLTHSDSQLGMSNYFPSRDLYVVDVASDLNVVRYPCCPEPYPDVTYKILLRRNMFRQPNQ
ncbi:hypothetical protein FSP39_007243 [Pinctada imbricata]|uniref:Neurotransmitter-gated ion-channel ligand-binding domain-containing protein n=1 Tax=Pinctada imbricata TaxID=66713 RepID=A0AA88YHQ0_PINIB|nr:hypothetical protein FSP39_007243 [Pinctada imbricata]